MILMKPIHNYTSFPIYDTNVVIPHKVNDFNETNSQPTVVSTPCQFGCDSSQS